MVHRGRKKSLVELFKMGLEDENHSVTLAYNGREGCEFDDVRLPGIDGFEVMRRLRALKNPVPILMLTARDADSDVLDAGAGDYLVKPFAFAIFARPAARSFAPARTRFGGCAPGSRCNARSHIARGGARSHSCGAHRHGVPHLRVFAAAGRAGRFLARLLWEPFWAFQEDIEPNTVDVYITLFRGKRDSGAEHKLIHAVPACGYIPRE
ncbi:MAG: response regulator transcription factor [Terriglobia bacterium]